jgi:hypothetical protein
MSWEEISRQSYPCPCGESTYEEVSYSDDWNRSETRRSMLCPDCKEHYTYVHSEYAEQYQHKYFARASGWVHNDVLRACLRRMVHGKGGAKCESMRLLAESLMNASELAGNPS